ncbi:phage tail spike protein [Weissella hellenica]|uniref:phage tail spike protein n=1 Tax=Weissella hellenica TaxID=46256 RepID=UPI00388A8A3B
MIPILYKSDEVDFYDNGLGALNDIYDVDVQEQRNGLFTLTASYPVSGRRYKDIEVGRIVLATPNQNDKAQVFRIIHTELDISGYALTIEADHITYDLTHNLVKSVHLQGNGQNAMTHLQESTVAPHLFRFISDLQHEGDSTLTMVNPMEAIAGTQGSILQIWGGELKRDNRTVSMLSRRGRNNFTSFRLGKNINGLKYTVDTANLVTRIVPSVQRPNGNEHELIIGDIVDSKNVGNYPNYYMQHVDVADNIKIDENDSDDVIKGKINAYAKNWFTQSANSKIDLPEVTVEIDVTSLQDSADYQDKFKNLEAIELTDSVTVYVPEFGVNVQAVVNELHYDPVAERVTSIVIGTSKLSFADANSNTLKELGSSINKIRENAVTAIVSANGKNTNYYDTEEPAHPVEGDLWFKSVGDETYLMIFKDGRWQEWVSTKTQDIINKAVDDALASAKEYTDELNEKQASEAAAFQSEANVALSSAAAERADMFKQSTSMATSAATHADSMANSAAAYGKAQAASALSSANSALTTAKSDLTTAIGQETEDRNKAVSAVNSQAQSYANQAKADAMSAASSADGVIRTAISSSADSLSATITQNKSSADSGISTAQTTANAAVDGLAFKVSKTDYDQKTGDLSTKINDVKETADRSAQTIADIQEADGKQDARMAEIEKTAGGIKSTVSDLSAAQGQQSGYISTLQQRADGFEATVTKVDNLSVGGRNLLLGTGNWIGDNTRWTKRGTVTDNSGTYMGMTIASSYGAWNSPVYMMQNAGILQVGKTYTFSTYVRNTSDTDTHAASYYDREIIYPYGSVIPLPAHTDWTRVSTTFNVTKDPTTSNSGLRWEGQNALMNGQIQFAGYKLEEGNVPTDWTPAPEDLSSATAKAQLTADKANLDLSTYKTDADGRISKAQSDITVTSKEVKAKVSQSDFDTKTGDLTTKYGQVKATADSVTTDVANYKKSNDGRIKADEANIDANSKAIALKVSQVDYDANNKTINGKFAQQIIDSNKILDSVTELQASVNSLGQVNQLMNTEFNPDLEGWTLSADKESNAPYASFAAYGSNGIGFNTTNAPDSTFASIKQTVPLPSTRLNTDMLSMSWRVNTRQISQYNHLFLSWQDANGKSVSDRTMFNWNDTNLNKYNVIKWENISIPIEAKQVVVSFDAREGTSAYLFQPMMVFEKSIGDYVAGNYNNNSRVSALEIDLNGITGLVNDPKKGLSATAALAANGLSVATTAKNNASTAIQTANGVQTTVKSFQKDMEDFQSTTTQTAGQITDEIEDRKSGDESVVTQVTGLIDSRVKNVTRGYESAISQSANAIMASVSQPNQLLNTEFNPDLEGWNDESTAKTSSPYLGEIDNGPKSRVVGFNTLNEGNNYNARLTQFINVGSNSSAISISWMSFVSEVSNHASMYLVSYDNSGNELNYVSHSWVNSQMQWKTQKWENITLPEGTVKIKLSIEAREGTKAWIAKPMLVFGSTVGTYTAGSYSGMNTSTVLELFKDNWALGIADNAGRIISGINGDTSGTVIQGKKLVINSDTTINGKAFIDGATIKNGSIAQAQIGNAAVGSAQIINVDVSKISGKIANFITANVDTLNARVLYGDTGHLGTTDTGRIINKQDNHLQLAAKGFYDSTNDRAQLELLGNSDNSISADMKGSLNYYGNPTDKGNGLGIRLKYNQILAIDESRGSKNLYLSPYAGGQVRIVSRDLNSYYDIAAANFRVSSQRKFKSDIKPLDNGALDIVNKTNIKSYTKNGISEIGVIADEAPSEVLSDDGKFINIYDYTSVLYKAVQELSAQVKELQNERPNN